VNGSLFYSLLPFIEQQNAYNLGQSPNTPTIGGGPYIGPFEARLQLIKTYLCPADASVPSHTFLSGQSGGPGSWGWALSNYAGNVMVFDPASSIVNGSKTIVSSMPDGSSNTVMFAHVMQACFDPNWNSSAPRFTEWAWYPWDGDWGQWDAPAFGEATYVALNGTIGTTYSNINGTHGPDFSSGQSVPPSGIPFMVGPVTSGSCTWNVTVSPHTAVMLAGLGDGSVRSVSQGVSVTTWWRACVPNDGNPLGSDW
jgi:hypothetical protein